MATLTGNKIKDTYYKLVQVDNGQLVQNGIGSPLTGSINLSGSLHVTGSQTVGGDLTVAGDVKARAFITELTQSTVLYKSGSTAFGDDATDTHSFSGSVTMHNSLALGNYANVSQSLDAAEDTIIANSSSAATALRAEYVAGDNTLSSSTATALRAEYVAADSSLSSSNASALRAEYIAADTALSSSQNTYINAKSAQHPLKVGDNLFSGSNTFTGSLISSGGFTQTGNIVSINEDSRLVQLDRRVQFRIIPTASGQFRGHLATTFSPSTDETVVSLYGGRVEIGSYVENGLFTDKIVMGTTSSITQVSGSVNMSGTLTLGNFSDVSASLDSANDTIIANSSSAHTQRTALSASSAAVIQTSASIASDYISIEKLKTFITGSYAEFQTAIGSL